jgi:maltose-binding protein MalE
MRVVGAIAAVTAIVGATAGPAVSKANPTITIWTDKDRLAAVTAVANKWGASKGVTIQVVQKDFGKIRDDLKTVAASSAPDVIVAAHDWTGQLSADGSVVPLILSRSALAKFPAYSTDAFSYGTAVKRLYGVPVALENIALIVNTKVAKAPKSFADMQSQALKFQKKAKGNIGLAVQQGASGDAYHMYPFFSGLCGYVFGKNSIGALDASNVGVANKRFIANSKIVDGWNKSGLINSKIDGNVAQTAFLGGKAAYWITGPWNLDALKTSGIKFKITSFPAIKCPSVPFLGVQGFMVTKFASTHGVLASAKDLVGSYMAGSAAQYQLASANGRFPANTDAGKLVKDAGLAGFGAAGKGGVAMPNIPQMNAVWGELGGAWAKSTKGSGSVSAKKSFTNAAKNIRNAIG